MRRRRPIHIAAGWGHVECTRYLLDQGAQTEVQDEDGRTPLITAAQKGQSSIVGELFRFASENTLSRSPFVCSTVDEIVCRYNEL